MTEPTEGASMPPRVLCVDDDVYVLAALHRQLRNRFAVTLAEGPTLGLQRLREDGPFAVVVTDLRMPGMDGHAFLAAARAIAPATVAVLMSGGAGDQADAADEGVFRRVAKPCRPDVLWAALDAAVAEHVRIAGVTR